MAKIGTIEYTGQRKTLFSRIKHGFDMFRAMMRDPSYKMPGRLKIALVVMAVYLISPIDIIPDFLPIIGFADDTALFAGVMWMLSGEITNYAKRIGKSGSDKSVF